MSKPRLEDRYELLDEKPVVTGGRLYRARDLAFAEIVGLKQFGPGCGVAMDERRQWENVIRHVQCLSHPQVVRIYSFDPASGLLVQEWVPGISLLDILRRRRELTAAETLRLLDSLPGLLDHLGSEAIPLPSPLLAKIFVQFESIMPAEEIVATPVDQWPPSTLKINALSLRSVDDGTAIDETRQTVSIDPRKASQIQENYGPREFARLLYELLGGRMRELDKRRYSPLSALREAGNAVIQRSLLAMPHPDCQALWSDLIKAQPGALRPRAATPPPLLTPRVVQIPEALLGRAHPGSLLKLDPEDSKTPSIRLSTRERFTIGRSAQHADFVARLLPDNEANASLTNRLSRVHAILESIPAGLVARDGNGSGPSLNGSTLDGTSLPADPGLPLIPRARLCLGDEYTLELINLPAPLPRRWEIANIAAWAGPAEAAPRNGRGVLIPNPLHGQPTIRHAAWLFTEAGFSFNATGRLVWDTRGRGESPAAFHFYRGAFWLRNRALPESALSCGDHPLQRDEIAPLFPGQAVRLGPHLFTVSIE